MRKIMSRLVLGLGIAVAPWTMIGCAEEKPADKPAETAPPATTTPPGETKPAEGAPAPAPAPAPAEAPK
jgi:hypothetical protein